MDKETEINHLRALQHGDTYFAQFFKNDVDQMVQNIREFDTSQKILMR